MLFYREFGTADEFAEVLRPVGGEVVQTAKGDGRWSALRLAMPSSEVIHCEAGAAVSGRGAVRKGRICFLMPWRKPHPYFYRGIEMPGNGVALYTEGAEHVGKGSGPGAWTIFVIECARFLLHLSRFDAGSEGPAPCSFIPIELQAHRRAKVETVVSEIAEARQDSDKAAAYSSPAVLQTLEDTILDTFAEEISEENDAAGRRSRRRHVSLSQVVLKSWELARQLPNENLCLEDLCAATGVSARQVQNAFIEMTGVRPTAFLRAHRLQRARRMLLSGGADSVKLAAYSCGFPDLGRFSAFYRNMFGELPRVTLMRGTGNPCYGV